ncbi:MAG: hypothetical protein R6V27_06445 [Balneolaceae bacterium]
MSIAPYKRRGVAGAQCGVKMSRQTKSPEACDTAKAMDLVDGAFDERKPCIHMDLNAGF